MVDLNYSFSERASIGARKRQEDASLVWQPSRRPKTGVRPLLAVLADGMGGHVSGERASRIACEKYVSVFSSGSTEIGTLLEQSLAASNSAIAKEVTNNADLKGMGSTLVAGYFDHSGLRWVSVGDSALLLYRNGTLRRLNADHSFGAVLDQQAQEGIISRETALNDNRRRALRSALMGEDIRLKDLSADAYPLSLGDWVILASDGLLTLPGDEIATLIRKHEMSPAEEMAGALITAVDNANSPNQDNTTLIAVHVTEGLGVEADEGPVAAVLSSLAAVSERLPGIASLAERVRMPNLGKIPWSWVALAAAMAAVALISYSLSSG